MKPLLSSGEGPKCHVYCTLINKNKNITNTSFLTSFCTSL